MNSIPQKQLDPKQLDRLAAQRQLYSKAKSCRAVQIFLSVPCVMVWSGFVLWTPALRVYAALWGIAVTLLDVLVINRIDRSLKKEAAKIQELFDCDVLDMRWHESKVGRKPDEEAISEAVEKFKRANPEYSTLRNWYPVAVGKLPFEFGRIVCQRTNCWWDAKLRRRYANWTFVAVAVVSGLVLVASLLRGLTLEAFVLAGLVPLLPALILGVRHYDEQNEAAASADQLKEHAEKMWCDALAGQISGNEFEIRARELQDEIFDHRRTSPLIFNWVYRRLRRIQEEQMNKGTEALVDEARRVLDRKNP